MKFFTLLALATSAVATATVKRQASAAGEAIAAVSSATANFNNALTNYEPGSGLSSPALQAANDLISTITTQTTTVQGISSFGLADAASLLPQVTALATLADNTITTLTDLEDQLTTDCVAVRAQELLGQAFQAVQGFENALVDKIDDQAGQTVAQGLVDQINASFQRGIQAYADASTPASCSGSSTGSGTATGTATATGATTTTTSTTATATVTSGGTGPSATTTTNPTSTTSSTTTSFTGAAPTNFVNYGAAVIAAVAAAVL